MNAVIWNALWASAVAGLFCSLPLLAAPELRARAAMVLARAQGGRRRATRKD